MTPRELPHRPEAEDGLLACAMIDGPDVIPRGIAAGVTFASFYDTRRGIAWHGLCALLEAGKPTDPHILADHLTTTRQIEAAGGVPTILSMSRFVGTTAHASQFIETVVSLATLREVIRQGVGLVERCYGWDGDDLAALIEGAAGSIIGAAPTSRAEQSWPEAIRSVSAEINRMRDPLADHHAGEVSFGFGDLDEKFQPMRGGQLVIIAARPSVGKSSLVRQIAHHNAARWGRHVIFASLEVMSQSLASNLAQTLSGISFRSLAKAHSGDVALYQRALAELDMKTLHVLAASQIRLATIRAKARMLRARGTPARLIVVDYLGLLPDAEPAHGENRASSVGRCSRALKQLAIEEDCPVVALAQLNRDSARDGREPALHDLRESGDIEQDADKVIFLHRPPTNPLTGAAQPEASMPYEVPSFFVNAIQAKGRDDGTALVSLNFRRAITRFDQIAKTT